MFLGHIKSRIRTKAAAERWILSVSKSRALFVNEDLKMRAMIWVPEMWVSEERPFEGR